jgi:hypothetical protein
MSLCVCMCIPPLLLGNSSIDTFPWQWIHATIENWRHHFLCGLCHIKGEPVGLSVYPLLLLGNSSVNTFPWQKRIVGGIIFHVVLVISKESRQLVLTRTYCLVILFNYWIQLNFIHFFSQTIDIVYVLYTMVIIHIRLILDTVTIVEVCAWSEEM